MALTAKETALFKDAFVLFDREARGAVTAADLQVVWSSMGRNAAAGEIEGARCCRRVRALGGRRSAIATSGFRG